MDGAAGALQFPIVHVMETPADGGEVEKYFASFGKKACHIVALAMAWG